jgi:predicted Zn-dependent protease
MSADKTFIDLIREIRVNPRLKQIHRGIILPVKKLFGISIIIFLFAFAIAAHDGLHEQIIDVTEQIKKDPQNAALYLKRAELYRLHAEWKNSENDFNRAEKLDGKLTVVNLGRGKLWFDTKQFSKAKLALGKFLAREPKSFEGILTMARVCAKLGQPNAAVKYFTEAIRLAPADSAEIYLERAETSAEANRIDEALRGLDEGISKLGALVTLQTAAIDLEVRRKNYDAALARLDKLTAQMERKESFLLRRGEILFQAKRACEARKSLLQAQKLYDSLTDFRKKVRAVKEQIARLEKLLAGIPAKNCT